MRLMVIYFDDGDSCTKRRDITLDHAPDDVLAEVQAIMPQRTINAVVEVQPHVAYDHPTYEASIVEQGPPLVLLKR